MTSPVEELREAAKRLRELASAATAGPWVTDHSEVYSEFQGGPWVGETLAIDDDARTRANAEYIASMHPGVALELAGLLEATALELEADHLPIWRDMLDDAGIAKHIEESKHFGPPFRLARLVNAHRGGGR